LTSKEGRRKKKKRRHLLKLTSRAPKGCDSKCREMQKGKAREKVVVVRSAHPSSLSSPKKPFGEASHPWKGSEKDGKVLTLGKGRNCAALTSNWVVTEERRRADAGGGKVIERGNPLLPRRKKKNAI